MILLLLGALLARYLMTLPTVGLPLRFEEEHMSPSLFGGMVSFSAILLMLIEAVTTLAARQRRVAYVLATGAILLAV
jgi:hypothetical protein